MNSRADMLQAVEVLKFALESAKVPRGDYLIALKDEPADGNDQSCLVELQDESWVVFFSERGTRKRLNRFERAADALDFFYWKLSRATKFWVMREQWEKAHRR